MRNCMRYVPWKDRKAVIADLKSIYQAVTLAESENEQYLEEMEATD